MSNRFQALFFDLGGTLFSYSNVGRWTFDAVLGGAERLGITATKREIGSAYRTASHAANERYIDQPFYLHRDLFRDTFALFARELGRDAPEEIIDWFETSLRESLIDNMVLRDDCLATLRALRARGLYLSIVSNIDDDHLFPMVERSGLGDVLDHWTSSEEARSCKPDPGFFRLALEKAGRSADEVLFVGDSPEHDVRGAQGVGMATALIVEAGIVPPLQSGRTPTEPDHRIEALSELLALA